VSVSKNYIRKKIRWGNEKKNQVEVFCLNYVMFEISHLYIWMNTSIEIQIL
jgi:hypothetical protein